MSVHGDMNACVSSVHTQGNPRDEVSNKNTKSDRVLVQTRTYLLDTADSMHFSNIASGPHELNSDVRSFIDDLVAII